MSYDEYKDMFLKAQLNKGPYHIYAFDIVNSKVMLNRKCAQHKMIALALKMYLDIKKIEEKEKRRILVKEEGFVEFQNYDKALGFGLKMEPFIYSDSFGFTIYKDSLDKETILKIFGKNMALLNIDFDFHLSDGYYETNNYQQGSSKYFRGYCIMQLLELHKDKNADLVKRLKKI